MKIDDVIQQRLDRFNRLFLKATNKSFEEDELYKYETFVIKETKSLVEFIENIGGIEWWNENIIEKELIIRDTINLLEKAGFNFDNGHSNNTIHKTIQFAHCLLVEPEMFQYMHGALAELVGDKGYYDNRLDVPKFDLNEK